jgi:uncharacterized paraquat-inducible protein A
MTRRHPDDDDDDADAFDPEGPDPSEMDYSDEPDLEVCPHCRRMISEEAERCPHCGEYLSAEKAPLSTPAWVVIGTIIALLIALLVWRF